MLECDAWRIHAAAVIAREAKHQDLCSRLVDQAALLASAPHEKGNTSDISNRVVALLNAGTCASADSARKAALKAIGASWATKHRGGDCQVGRPMDKLENCWDPDWMAAAVLSARCDRTAAND